MDTSQQWVELAFQASQKLVDSVDAAALWKKIGGVVARIVGRGRADAVAEHEHQLDEDRRRLALAEDADREVIAGELVADWNVRLKDALKRDPEAMAELRELLAELNADQPDQAIAGQNITMNAKGRARIYNAGRDMNFGGNTSR